MFKLAFLLIVLCQVSLVHAASSREEYELQERCAMRAEAWFKKTWGEGITETKNGRGVATYRNHYNGTLNKCFVLLNYQNLPYKDPSLHGSTQISLLDVNEGKFYGSMSMVDEVRAPKTCNVNLKRCKSEAEWESLIAPYMGD